jgi:hypothetical protein
LGSFFAGVKAGTLGGILYVGGMAAFNAALLFALKPQVLAAISQTYSQVCTSGAPVNSTSSLEDCFSLLVAVDVPYVAFVGFFVALLYTGLFGLWYERFPGSGPLVKGEVIAGIVGFNLVFFGFYGFNFNVESGVATGAFLAAWTLVFGYVVGRLYKKYTRTVSFLSQDEGELRIFVDGRDLTGRSRTYATTSTHKVRGEAADDASFKEWEVAGGITVEDPRSFETLMEVNGDGSLKALVGKKY